NADVLLRFDYGAVANVHLDYLQRTYRRACDFIGEDGVIAWDYIAQSVTVYGKEDRRIEVFQESINTERNQMFVDEMRHFVRCIEAREPPVLDAAGGRAILEVARAARGLGVSVVVRVTPDCPLLDPAVSGLVVDRFVEARGAVDYASNTHPPTFPDGLDTEVFSFAALARTWREATAPSEREHVTAYIWKHPELFRLLNVARDPDLSDRRWTVDEPTDLEFARAVYDRLGETFGVDDVLALLRRQPELEAINRGPARNEGYARSVRTDHVPGAPRSR